ncbi:hypothetical protein BC941DRAFT_428065 [Chlamydoabsidia padenii]|nr:hypothetical protein BC941DRAFT_428065 [Chlamydoabsidia padenii]
MVQCDQCEVWQHCKCVGLEEEKDIPDQYYCEQCRPQNHKSVKMAHGRRYKRLYNSLGFSQDNKEENTQVNKSPKRRKKAKEAPGSRKSSRQQPPTSNDSVLYPSPSPNLFDNSTEWTTQNTTATLTAATTFDNNNSGNSSSPLTDVDEVAVLTRSRVRSGHSPVTDSIPLSSPTMGRRRKQQTTISSTTQATSASSPTTSITTTTTTVINTTTTTLASSLSPPPSSSSSSPLPALPSTLRNAQGRFNKTITTGGADSRLSTPHPTPASPLAPTTSSPLTTTTLSTMGRDDVPTSYWNQDGLPAREGSPPAKIKYPTARMTMADMNKRAKQIMDHLNKMKSALEQQQPKEDQQDIHPAENEINEKTDLKIDRSDLADDHYQHEDDSVLPINMSIISTTTHSSSDRHHHEEHSVDHDSADEELRPRSQSTCSVASSISSASTLPLLLDDGDDSYHSSLLLSTSPTSPLPLDKLFGHHQQQESSSEMMDRVYRELLKFQRKFGGVLQVQQTSSVR